MGDIKKTIGEQPHEHLLCCLLQALVLSRYSPWSDPVAAVSARIEHANGTERNDTARHATAASATVSIFEESLAAWPPSASTEKSI